MANVALVPDAAWAMPLAGTPFPTLARYGLQKRRFVAFSVRSLSVSDHEPQVAARYRQAIAQAVHWLVKERGLDVALVAHTHGPRDDEDDRLASAALYNSLPTEVRERVVLVDDDFSPAQLAAFYGSAALLVGTRFHAVLLAAAAGTPVIAIPYFGLKTAGTLKDMGLSDCLLPMEELSSERLIQTIANALNGQQDLRQRIVHQAQRMRGEAIEVARRVVHSFASGLA
jgi:polysaccharide pyruvyl transferase WcaK-like protein